jgi:hypothetical protein
MLGRIYGSGDVLPRVRFIFPFGERERGELMPDFFKELDKGCQSVIGAKVVGGLSLFVVFVRGGRYVRICIVSQKAFFVTTVIKLSMYDR